MNTTRTENPMNVKTHTATVHKAHAKRLRGEIVPACMTFSQILNLHYSQPTDEAVTCTKAACQR